MPLAPREAAAARHRPRAPPLLRAPCPPGPLDHPRPGSIDSSSGRWSASPPSGTEVALPGGIVDAYIREWAVGIADWGLPVAVRFGQQMRRIRGLGGHRRVQRRLGSDLSVGRLGRTGSALRGHQQRGSYLDGQAALAHRGRVDSRSGREGTLDRQLSSRCSSTGDIMGFIWVEAAREADWRITGPALPPMHSPPEWPIRGSGRPSSCTCRWVGLQIRVFRNQARGLMRAAARWTVRAMTQVV